LATSDDSLVARIQEFKNELRDKVEESAEEVERLVF
jgi:5-(carboxyamino)imidazole ribonucleotide mutase